MHHKPKKYYQHPFLYIVQICVLLIGSLFFHGGCPASPTEVEKAKKDAFEQYTGKWKLFTSRFTNDSSFIDIAWLELQSDSIFYSNSAFFWYGPNDSLRYQSLHGHWSTGFAQGDRSEFPSSPTIILSADSVKREWILWGGGTKTGDMEWNDRNNFSQFYIWHPY